MKTSVDLDAELVAQIDRAVAATREKPATVVRMAIRLGLPALMHRLEPPLPDGYFARDYPEPDERQQLAEAMARQKQTAER